MDYTCMLLLIASLSGCTTNNLTEGAQDGGTIEEILAKKILLEDNAITVKIEEQITSIQNCKIDESTQKEDMNKLEELLMGFNSGQEPSMKYRILDFNDGNITVYIQYYTHAVYSDYILFDDTLKLPITKAISEESDSRDTMK